MSPDPHDDKPASTTNPAARAPKTDGPRAGEPLQPTTLGGENHPGTPPAKDPVKIAQREAAQATREGRINAARAHNEAAAERAGEDETDYASFLDEMEDEDFDPTDTKTWSSFVSRLKEHAKDPVLGKLNSKTEADRLTEANRIRAILREHVRGE